MTRLLSQTFSKETEEVEFDQNKSYPVNTLTVGAQAYKMLGCQIQFNSILDQCIQFMLQIESSKYESSMRLIELIKVSYLLKVLTLLQVYNSTLKSQVLLCKAYYDKKVESITAKHLALSSNCVLLIQREILPNLTNNLLLSEDQGYNIRKMMQAEADDLKKDL